MKIKIISIISLLLLNMSIFAQKQLSVVDYDDKPLKEVSVYVVNNKIGSTDEFGKIIIDNQYSNDTIYFLKSEFQNRGVHYKDLVGEIRLDSLKTTNIEGIVLKKYNAVQLIKKIIQAGKSDKLYSSLKNVSISNQLRSTNDLFYSVDNNFYWKAKQGRFIENRNNIVKNFEGRTFKEGDKNYIEKIIEMKGEKIALYPFRISNYGYVTGQAIPQLFEIEKRAKDYVFEVKKREERIIISFRPKQHSENTFLGRIIVDSQDFGIYEGIFNLVKSSKNMVENKFVTKNLRQDFLIEKEQLIIKNKKIDGKYAFDFSKYDLEFRVLTGKNRDELIKNQLTIKSIDFLNVETSEKFNLSTFEFE